MLRQRMIFRNSGNKDTNYMLAILDSRMKIVAHERFQYVLLKKFGEIPICFAQKIRWDDRKEHYCIETNNHSLIQRSIIQDSVII